MDHKGKTGSKQSDKALEYYRLYSDNNKLPKYFCGTYDDKAQSSTSYKRSSPINIPLIHIEDRSTTEADDDKVRNPSPTSSVTSNRKLEWDNGADIGYENIANKTLLHKSLSLPILTSFEKQFNTSSESKESSNSEGKPTDDKKPTTDISNSGVKKKSTASESSCKKEVLNYIKAKVGLPIAHSTPFSKLEITKPIYFEIKHQSSSDSDELKHEGKLESSSDSDVIKPGYGEEKLQSSSDSNGVKSNERKYETSSDSNDIGFKIEDPTKIVQSSSSSSGSGLKFESLANKLTGSEESTSTKSLESKIELYTPRISKEKNIQNIQVLIENAEKCIKAGKDTEKIVAENKCNLSPTSFFFEIKAPSTDVKVADAAIVSSSTSHGISLHPSSKFESAASATPENSLKKDCNSTNERKSSTSASSDNKSKVHSLENLTSTTNETVRKWNSQLDLTLPQRMKYFKKYRDKKIKNLCLTKPVYVECLGPSQSKDKNIQTSSENISIGIQTEIDTKVSRESEKNQQSVLYMFHPQNDRYNTNSTTQTDSDVVFSNCNSFEFLNGSDCNKPSPKTSASGTGTGKSDKAVTDYHSKQLKRSTVKTDLTHLTSNTDNSSSSKENYLSDLLSQQLSVDVDKKLELLQKLYKSKKYDKETKKYYVRKVLKSILNNYSEDSSLYSDKITPNIAPNIPPRDRMIGKSYDNTSSDNKRGYVDNKRYNSDSSRENQLKNNVPWVPIAPQNSSETKSVISSQSKSTKQRSQRFTLPSYHKNSTTESSSGNIQKPSTDGSERQEFSWKENKTLSERILEMRNRKISSGDSVESPNDELLFFAKRERENQINWINNEIEHLAKLKELLETKEKERKDGAVKKSTAIYMITAEGPNKDTNDVPVKSSIIRNGDISQTKFVVKNSKGTTAYKVHELQTCASSAAYKVVRTVQKDNNEDADKIVEDTGKSKTAVEDKTDDIPDSVRTCRCRSQSSHRDHNSQSDKHECSVKLTSPVKSKEFHEWRRKCKEVDSNLSQENSSHRSFVTSAKVASCSDGAKVNFSNAVLISNTVRPSLTIPGDSVRRLVLEIPLDSKVEHTQVENEDVKTKSVQTTKSLLDNSTESTSSASSLSSSTCTNSSVILCSCCRKLIAASESSLAINSELYNNITPPPVFCPPCYNESKKKTLNPEYPYFTQPQHQCTCHNMNHNKNNNNLDPVSINKIRDTLKELEELEEREKHCHCINKKLSRHSDNICMVCNCKIKNQKSSKKPVAYLLTFEPGEYESPKNKHKVKSLEEVRIKLPGGKPRRKKSEDEKRCDDKEEGHKKHKHSKHKIKKSLQEYLETNHPSFVKAAEERRKCMIDLAFMREQRCQKYKQLLALTNGIPMQKPCYSDIHQKRIFTSKEMKNMTTKKYKKLPEVQQKLVENRTKQIKKANRLLADIFNKKLRERVLLGNPNISASTSVINLV